MTLSQTLSISNSLSIPVLKNMYYGRVHFRITSFYDKTADGRVVLKKLFIAFLSCDGEGHACVNFNNNLFQLFHVFLLV